MQEFLSDPAEVLGVLEAHAPEAIDQKSLADAGASLARDWTGLERSRLRGLLLAFVLRIEVHKTRVSIHIAPSRLAKVLRSGSMELPPAHQAPPGGDPNGPERPGPTQADGHGDEDAHRRRGGEEKS